MTRDTTTDDETEKNRAEAAGETAAAPFAALTSGVFAFARAFVLTIVSKVPKRSAIFSGMIKAGYQGLYKSSKGAAVANVIYGDGYVKPKPVEFDAEAGKYRTESGEEWTATSGHNPDRIGDAPIVWGVADSHEIIAPVQARITEKVDLGPSEYEVVSESPQGYQAVADGGVAQPFDDVLVDASNPDAGADGMIVSMRKAYDLHWSQAGTEEMRNQEMRGRLAEADPNADKKQLMLIIAAILGALALGLFGPALAARVAGGDGGGAVVGMMLPLLASRGWL